MTGQEITLLVLGSLVGFVLLCALIALACMPKVRGPEDPFFLGYFRVFNIVYSRLVHGVKTTHNYDFLPKEGQAIIVANHLSGADPLLLATVTRRRIRFLMAREYYETFGLQWFFRGLGAIPVNRDGNDLSATREALKHLKQGGVIGVFPEGGIQEEDDALADAKNGVALLALKTGASIYPVYIDGPSSFDSIVVGVFKPTRTKLIRGAPIEIAEPERKPSREDLARVTETIMNTLRDLREQATGETSHAQDKSHSQDKSTAEGSVPASE